MSHPEGTAEPVVKASAERRNWVVHQGSFLACFGMGRLIPGGGSNNSSVWAGTPTGGSKKALQNQP
jgi:hypothetical protein